MTKAELKSWSPTLKSCSTMPLPTTRMTQRSTRQPLKWGICMRRQSVSGKLLAHCHKFAALYQGGPICLIFWVQFRDHGHFFLFSELYFFCGARYQNMVFYLAPRASFALSKTKKSAGYVITRGQWPYRLACSNGYVILFIGLYCLP